MVVTFPPGGESGDGAGDLPTLGEILGQFFQKARRTLKGLPVTGIEPEFGVGEVEFLLASGDPDIEEAPFFLESRLILQGTGSGEHSLREPCQEDGLPFEALGLMDAGEADTVLLVVASRDLAGFGAPKQGQLGQEFIRLLELLRVVGERVQVVATRLVVRELRLHVVVVESRSHRGDHLGGGCRHTHGGELCQRPDQLGPRSGRLGGGLASLLESGEVAASLQQFGRLEPEVFGGFRPDAGKKTHHPLEGDLVVRVDRELQEGRDILDVRLLEEAQSARDPEGNATPGELQLDLHRVVVGTVEDGDLAEVDSFVVEFQHALGDKGGLLIVGGERNEGRFCDRGLADGPELLGKLARIVQDGGIGQFQHLRNTAVVRLDPVDDGVGVALGELKDVCEIGPAPRVDRLGVVTDDHDVLMGSRQRVDQSGLEAVGVLVLIDEDRPEAPLVGRGDLRTSEQEFVRLGEKVVEVEGVDLLLASFVGRGDLCDLLLQVDEVTVAAGQQGAESLARVAAETDQFGENLPLGESLVIGAESQTRHHGLEQFLLILPVHDGESFAESDGLGMAAEDPVTDRVECAAPEPLGSPGQEVVHPFEHFAGGLVGEG